METNEGDNAGQYLEQVMAFTRDEAGKNPKRVEARLETSSRLQGVNKVVYLYAQAMESNMMKIISQSMKLKIRCGSQTTGNWKQPGNNQSQKLEIGAVRQSNATALCNWMCGHNQVCRDSASDGLYFYVAWHISRT